MSNKLEQSKKIVKIGSLLLLLFSIAQAVSLCVGMILNDASLREQMKGIEYANEVLLGVKIVMGILAGIGVLFNIYLAVRYNGVSKGNIKGKAYLVWTWIFLIYGCFSVMSSISPLTQNGGATVLSNWTSLVSELALVVIYILLIVSDKNIRNHTPSDR